MRYDLELFHRLQEEYRSKPIVPAPRGLDPDSLTEAARTRAEMLDKRIGIRGKRVLEVGCGRGHMCRVLADEFGCEAVGVDITEYAAWQERPDLQLHRHDIATLDNDFLETFDVIYSFAVWEHIERPFHALQATRDLLRPDGKMYLFANLYRGPKASHRYREIFFPWPHLLFTDEVIGAYYDQLQAQEGGPERPPHPGAAWVNKLTTAQYEVYFDLLDLEVEKLWWSPINFDEEFYVRFEDILGRYPRFDLERDFIYAILSPRTAKPLDRAQQKKLQAELERVRERSERQAGQIERLKVRSDSQTARVARLQARVDTVTKQRNAHRRRLQAMRRSASWRVTRPVRWLSRRLRRNR